MMSSVAKSGENNGFARGLRFLVMCNLLGLTEVAKVIVF